MTLSLKAALLWLISPMSSVVAQAWLLGMVGLILVSVTLLWAIIITLRVRRLETR